jgi:hypothetical protein
MRDIDRMNKMLEAIQVEVTEDPPTTEVEAFFKLLKALEEPLHKHIELTLIAFITWLMVIKSKYFFSNNCYNDLIKLISDILSKPHKVPKDMYQSKKIMFALNLKYEKIDTYPDNYMLFWKEHTNEKKCLGCGQSRFIKVVTHDGEKVMMKVAQKQLCYFPITHRLKWLTCGIKKAYVRMIESWGTLQTVRHGRCLTGSMQTLSVMQEIFASGWRQMTLIHSVQTLHHTFAGSSLLCHTIYHHIFV